MALSSAFMNYTERETDLLPDLSQNMVFLMGLHNHCNHSGAGCLFLLLAETLIIPCAITASFTCIMCPCQFAMNKLLMKHLLYRDPQLMCARIECKGETLIIKWNRLGRIR